MDIGEGGGDPSSTAFEESYSAYKNINAPEIVQKVFEIDELVGVILHIVILLEYTKLQNRPSTLRQPHTPD
jgi:hypothetical protein